MRILVTAGPTREYIDPVRFLSNDSSGRMGFAIARAARRRGHEVVLVAGPTPLRDPKGVETVRVVSARDMAREANRRFEACDCAVLAAAVADFRPRRRSSRKLKKEEISDSIPLVRNPDIAAGLGRRKGKRLLVGFALETDRGRDNALRKLHGKNLDLVVLNSPAVIGAERGTVEILGSDGMLARMADRSKTAIARRIVALAEAYAPGDSKKA
jgi:phosphopantothenoylcysteine decarboxylase/phosphopantothenate--cysteine ligase